MFCHPSQYFLQFYSISFEVMGNGTAVLSDPNRLGKKMTTCSAICIVFQTIFEMPSCISPFYLL